MRGREVERENMRIIYCSYTHSELQANTSILMNANNGILIQVTALGCLTIVVLVGYRFDKVWVNGEGSWTVKSYIESVIKNGRRL